MSTGTGRRVSPRPNAGHGTNEVIIATDAAPKVRRAARVVLVDGQGRVLLFRHEDSHNDPHWQPPGGGLEAGETFKEAALREVAEELGRTDIVVGPMVWEWEHDFYYGSRLVRQYERAFLALTDRLELGEGLESAHAADGIVDHRWWDREALASCDTDVWPPELPVLIQDLAGRDPSRAPLRLPFRAARPRATLNR
ncbi:MAG: NUDIX hydrolase [Frankia sp.]